MEQNCDIHTFVLHKTWQKIVDGIIMTKRLYRKKSNYMGLLSEDRTDTFAIVETTDVRSNDLSISVLWNNKQIKIFQEPNFNDYYTNQLDEVVISDKRLENRIEFFTIRTGRDSENLFLFLFDNCEEITRNIIRDTYYFKYNPKEIVFRF